ncbi:hypothetical protein BH23CHL8_BH23CHL8_06160 [soil metagenome]
MPGSSGYASYSGTSMATPHVTGTLALCASMDVTPTAPQLRERLIETVRPTTSMAGVTVTGGRLDVGRLAERCAPGSMAPGPKPSPDPPLGGSLTRIVDDLDPGFRLNGSGWRSAATGFRKHHYWVPVRRATVRSSAAWRVTLDAPGRYQVKVKIPRQNATTRSAVYRVKTANGFVRRVLNQRQRRGDWVGLGIHELPRDVVVRLTDKTGEPGAFSRRVAFDAIKLIPRDGTSGATRTVDPEVSETRPDEPNRDRDRDGDADREAAISPVDATPTPAPEPTPEPTPDPDVTAGPDATPGPDATHGAEARPDRGPSRTPEPAAPSTEPSPSGDGV